MISCINIDPLCLHAQGFFHLFAANTSFYLKLSVGKARCQVTNTIFFVAFDFEEWSVECNIASWPFQFDCGSNSFVRNITSYLKKTGGTMAGAIVLETMLNHNSSAGIQIAREAFLVKNV